MMPVRAVRRGAAAASRGAGVGEAWVARTSLFSRNSSPEGLLCEGPMYMGGRGSHMLVFGASSRQHGRCLSTIDVGGAPDALSDKHDDESMEGDSESLDNDEDPPPDTAERDRLVNSFRKEVQDLLVSCGHEGVPSDARQTVSSVVQMMEKWHDILSRLEGEATAASHHQRRRRMDTSTDAPLDSLSQELTTQCAEQMENLLNSYISIVSNDPSMAYDVRRSSSSDSDQESAPSYPFVLAMDAWRLSGSPLSGERAASVLDQWGGMYGGNMDLAPTVDQFNVVLDAYVRCSKKGTSEVAKASAKRALEILHLLCQMQDAGDIGLSPNVETYSQVIRALRRSCTSSNEHGEVPSRIVDVLGQMERNACSKFSERRREGTGTADDMRECRFLFRAYNDAVITLLHTNTVESTCRSVADIFERVQEFASNIDGAFRWGEVTIDSVDSLLVRKYIGMCCTNAIRLLSRIQEKESGMHAAEAAEASLRGLQRRFEKKHTEDVSPFLVMPRPSHFGHVIIAWANTLNEINFPGDDRNEANSDPFYSLQKCEDLVREMEEMHHSCSAEIKVPPLNGVVYEKVLWALTRLLDQFSIVTDGDKLAASKMAESTIYHVLQLLGDGELHFYHNRKGLTRSMNYALKVLCKSGGDYAAQSLFLLDKMESCRSDGTGAFSRPDSITYGYILSALARSEMRQAGSKAFSILSRMKERDIPLKPSHYESVVVALSRSRAKDAASKAHFLLGELMVQNSQNLKPTIAIQTGVISAWARSRSRDAAAKALELLSKMEDHFESTQDPACKPDIVAYGSVLDALSKSRDKGSLQKALDLLKRMESKYQAGDVSMRPNSLCYTSVIVALARSGKNGSVRMAEDLIKKMDGHFEQTGDASFRPDTVAFTALIEACSRSKERGMGERAEAWLDIMIDRATAGGEHGMRPNNKTYTSVINCWWRSGDTRAGERAEMILRRMEEAYANGDFEAKPDAYAYTSTINAISRSQDPDKAKRAWNLLLEMKEQYMDHGNLDLMPNVVAFTAVINSCAHTTGSRKDKQEALHIALKAATELQNSSMFGKPGHIFYRSLLQVYAYQVPNSDNQRRKLASVTFEKCCREGQVDSSVLAVLKKGFPGLYHKLPGVASTGKTDLPEAWSRNVESRGK